MWAWFSGPNPPKNGRLLQVFLRFVVRSFVHSAVVRVVVLSSLLWSCSRCPVLLQALLRAPIVATWVLRHGRITAEEATRHLSSTAVVDRDRDRDRALRSLVSSYERDLRPRAADARAPPRERHLQHFPLRAATELLLHNGPYRRIACWNVVALSGRQPQEPGLHVRRLSAALPPHLQGRPPQQSRDDVLLLPLSITPSGPRKLPLLATAVIRNDLPLVRRILEVAKGWNLDAGGEESPTALTYAASLGHGEAVQTLLDAGANPAKALRLDTWRLGRGLREGLLEHPDLVSKIILSDTPQDFYKYYVDRKGNGTLGRQIHAWSDHRIYQALDYEIPELVRSQYKAGHSVDDLEDELFNEMQVDGRDPQRKGEALRAFAEHPNLTFRKRIEVAGFRQDKAWLHELAAAASRQELVEFILPAAASAGAIDLVRRALDSGGDVNQSFGVMTPSIPSILAAAQNGHLDVVELLADNDEIDVDDGLLAAATCGHNSLVEHFLEFGADVDFVSDEFTPLYVAIDNKHVESLRLLLDAGATLSIPLCPPLELACYGKGAKIEIVQLLLEYGADVNGSATGQYYGTVAGHYSHVPLIATCNYWGGDFLTLSQCRAIADVVQLLLDRGADPEALDDGGHTALYHAEKSGLYHSNTLVSEVLRKHLAGTEVHKS